MINTGQRYLSVLSEVEAAARECGRDPSSVRLIAVSKTKPLESVKSAFDVGCLDFGENKPQELVIKQAEYPSARWHMIGHLQKNKVRHIVGKTALIHSVDSIELAREIEKRAAAADVTQNILIQVNVSGEESKFGISPGGLSELIREIDGLEHINLTGLMTISVKDYTAEQNTALFLKLRELSEKYGLRELSMGMSGDWRQAIAAGATMIRIGTSIFGERDYSNKK